MGRGRSGEREEWGEGGVGRGRREGEGRGGVGEWQTSGQLPALPTAVCSALTLCISVSAWYRIELASTRASQWGVRAPPSRRTCSHPVSRAGTSRVAPGNW